MKKFVPFLLLIAILLSFAACSASGTGTKGYSEHTNLVKISRYTNLYYDSDTKIVYFLFNECTGYSGYGYMSAYYAPNGLPYLYDGGLVEIRSKE